MSTISVFSSLARSSWRRNLAALLMLAVYGLPVASQAGILGDVRENASSGGGDKSRGSYYDDDDDDDDSSFGDDLISGLFCALFNSDSDDDSYNSGGSDASDDSSYITAYFPRWPYEADVPGYLVFNPEPHQPIGSAGSGRFSVEYGDNFEELSNVGGHLWLTSSSGWGIDTEFNHRIEDLDDGGHDKLWTGDFNITYRFIETEALMVRTGMGWNWLEGPFSTPNGFNWTVAADLYPCKPLVFTTEMDLGKVGSSTLFHGRATGGVVINRVEIFAGYDYWDVGTSVIDGVIFGAKIYF